MARSCCLKGKKSPPGWGKRRGCRWEEKRRISLSLNRGQSWPQQRCSSAPTASTSILDHSEHKIQGWRLFTSDKDSGLVKNHLQRSKESFVCFPSPGRHKPFRVQLIFPSEGALLTHFVPRLFSRRHLPALQASTSIKAPLVRDRAEFALHTAVQEGVYGRGNAN